MENVMQPHKYEIRRHEKFLRDKRTDLNRRKV